MKIYIAALIVLFGACWVEDANAQLWFTKPFLSTWGTNVLPAAEATKSKRDTTHEQSKLNSTYCVYVQNSSVITCNGPNSVVECEASSSTDQYGILKYDLFGIGKPVNGEVFLFPRKLDNTAWLTNEFILNGVEQKISMYSNDLNTNYGFKVEDVKCLERVLETIRSSLRNEPVFIENPTTGNPASVNFVAEP